MAQSIESIQEIFRICEESDAAMEGGWTWAFPDTPFVVNRAVFVANTDAALIKFIRG